MTAPAFVSTDVAPSLGWLRRLGPGLVLAAAVAIAALAVGRLEEIAFGRAVIESLVVAILLGMAVRAVMPASAQTDPGVSFAAKELLEFAVLLLGASVDLPRLFASGPTLALGIVGLVIAALGLGLAIGRAAGLPPKLAILVACGNAICGNSAIAAVAPAIGARREDVAASIALTALIGVGMVIVLPLLVQPLGLSHYQFGVLAGLTVYAVPQVLAASFAVSPYSAQVATAVKLARVLMLGPIVTFFSLRERVRAGAAATTTGISLSRLVPWFITGFVALAVLRSMGAVPDAASAAASQAAKLLTVGAMAALGLSVDLRDVRAVGARVIVTVVCSLVALFVLALAIVHAV